MSFKTSIKRILLFGMSVCVAIFFMFWIEVEPYSKVTEHKLGHFVPNVSGVCVLPKHDPYDPEVMRYFWKPKPLHCKRFEDLIYVNKSGFLLFNETSILASGNTLHSIRCNTHAIIRHDDYTVDFASALSLAHDTPRQAESDYVQVECYDSYGTHIYQQLLFSVNTKLNKNYNKIKPETKNELSVVMFGLDAVSNVMAKRQLPNTVKYLVEQLGAFEFKGYTKVASNSFPNIFSLLSGKKSRPTSTYKNQYVDHVTPMIWTNYSQKGYATFFSEDFPDMSIFNQVTKGFDVVPTDHYFRPYFLAAYNRSKPFSFVKANNKQMSCRGCCFGNQAKHTIQIDHLKQFIEMYRGKKKFAFSWHTRMGHNDPQLLSLCDNDVLNFLKWMKNDGCLNTTILFVMADHGSYHDYIRNTPVGRIEERIPMMYVVMPQHLLDTTPHLLDTLTWNSNQLTSHFDTHATLKDILGGHFQYQNNVKKKQKDTQISFFQKIPKSRTCQDAKVIAAYCPCYSQKSLDRNSTMVFDIARKAVDSLNAMLAKDKHKCFRLDLNYVEDAQLLTSNFNADSASTKMSLFRYVQKMFDVSYDTILVLFRTHPGEAMFEATATYTSHGDITIMDPIIRSNSYGNQSYCTTKRSLKPFCLCLK